VAAQVTGPSRAAIVTAALVCAACGLAVLLLPSAASSVVSDVAQGAAAVLASATTARRARRLTGRARWECVALSLGCLAWGLGEAWWTWASVRFATVPFPSVADLGFLCFPLLARRLTAAAAGRRRPRRQVATTSRRPDGCRRGGSGELDDQPGRSHAHQR
jgi:hypothetical protein